MSPMNPRLPAIGLGLVAAGFAWWGLRAASVGESTYLAMNLLRVSGALLALVGLLFLARGRTTMPFRLGVFGFLAAAVIAFVYNVTGTITLPEDLSTLFGLMGASAAAYGAYHWFEPGGDSLAAAWIAAGFGFMAANPGTYLLVGFLRGDIAQGGWLLGSLMACGGCILVAATIHGIVDAKAAPGQGDGQATAYRARA